MEHPEVYFKYTLNMLIDVLKNQLANRLYEKCTFYASLHGPNFISLEALHTHMYLLHVCAGFTSEALFIIISIIGFAQ